MPQFNASLLTSNVRRCFQSWLLGVCVGGLAVHGQNAPAASTPSALDSNPQGWTDILPGPELQGWSRVPVPPTGKLGREQWHVDAASKVLICDGDGGHDMLLWNTELGDSIFHL